MARGTTGAPRNMPGQDTRDAAAPGFGDPGAEGSGPDPQRSGGSRLVALRRAGPAIMASGLTMVAGMLCLLAAESNDISALGPVAAIGIAVGLIAMVTLLPAILVVFGRWIFWPARPGYGSLRPARHGFWSPPSTRMWRAPRPMTGTCCSR